MVLVSGAFFLHKNKTCFVQGVIVYRAVAVLASPAAHLSLAGGMPFGGRRRARRQIVVSPTARRPQQGATPSQNLAPLAGRVLAGACAAGPCMPAATPLDTLPIEHVACQPQACTCAVGTELAEQRCKDLLWTRKC